MKYCSDQTALRAGDTHTRWPHTHTHTHTHTHQTLITDDYSQPELTEPQWTLIDESMAPSGGHNEILVILVRGHVDQRQILVILVGGQGMS